MGARTQTHTPAKKFVYEKCSTYSRGSYKKNGRECQNGGEQRRRGGRETGKHTHTHVLAHTISNTSFSLKKAHLQGTHLACSYKIIYSVGVYALPRHVNTEAYSEPQPKVSWLKMARIYVLSQHKSGLKL